MSESKKHKNTRKRRLFLKRLQIAAQIIAVVGGLCLIAWAGSKADRIGDFRVDESSQGSMKFSSESSEAVYRAVEKVYPASMAGAFLDALTETQLADVLTDISVDSQSVLHATTADAYAVDVSVQLDEQENLRIYISHVAPKAVLSMATDIRFIKDEDHYTACIYNEGAFGVYDTEMGVITEAEGDRMIIAFNESLQDTSADISQPGFVQDNPIVVTVEQIVKEVNTDITVAKTKYSEKFVNVTGQIRQVVVGGTMTYCYLYGTQEDTGMFVVCWQEGTLPKAVTEGETYSFLGQIREISNDGAVEIANCQLQLEEPANNAVIEIRTAEQIYALGRILQSRTIQNDYIIKDITYDIQTDFALFTYPEYVTTTAEMTQYLRTANYKLMEDVELTLQKSAGPEYFTGIGSAEKVFTGVFDGNGKTITMSAKGDLDLAGTSDYGVALFDQTEGAILQNVNIHVVSDIKVIAAAGQINIGGLVGYADKTMIENCKVVITDAVVGAEYPRTQHIPTSIGGIAGISTYTVFRDCQVVMENATLKGTGTNVTPARQYGAISVGGILGFAGAGSNNTENIGKLGCQLYNCSLVSKNDMQTDVIVASVERGQELAVGGIVGCAFNNVLIKDCTAEIVKGNISAIKTGTVDDLKHGAQAGGIIGRMEHTGEVSGCTVVGDYLTILAKCPNNVTCAGGIVGVDMGPYHRDINSINHSHFDGSGTSQIRVEITTTNTLSQDKVIAAGGVVGSGAYIILDCSVKNVTIYNDTANIGNPTTYIGEIAGFISLKKTAEVYGTGYNWFYNAYFKKRNPGLYDCYSENVNVVKTENVQNLQY